MHSSSSLILPITVCLVLFASFLLFEVEAGGEYRYESAESGKPGKCSAGSPEVVCFLSFSYLLVILILTFNPCCRMVRVIYAASTNRTNACYIAHQTEHAVVISPTITCHAVNQDMRAALSVLMPLRVVLPIKCVAVLFAVHKVINVAFLL